MIETMDVPRDNPMDQVAKSKQINMSIEGSEKNAKSPFKGIGIVYIKGNSEVIIKMTTGSRAVITLVEKDGSFDSSISRGTKVVLGVHAICLTVLANQGPAKIMAGVATKMPYSKVVPISAFN